MTTLAPTDWRSEFRLHALDMSAPDHQPAAGGGQHWMLQDETIREWLTDVAKAYEELIAVGGDPFDGQPLTLEAVIAKLGFIGRENPQGFFATAKFTAALVAATTREATGAQRDALRLRRRARRGLEREDPSGHYLDRGRRWVDAAPARKPTKVRG